jgi:hypothetical protein
MVGALASQLCQLPIVPITNGDQLEARVSQNFQDMQQAVVGTGDGDADRPLGYRL